MTWKVQKRPKDSLVWFYSKLEFYVFGVLLVSVLHIIEALGQGLCGSYERYSDRYLYIVLFNDQQ